MNFLDNNACVGIDLILDTIHDDVLITDGIGRIIRVSKSFESVYGVKTEEAIGKTVFQLEAEGFFKPSITAIVLRTGEKQTLRQQNNLGRDLVVTAVPVKDENDVILNVVSFTRDITDFLALEKQYKELETKIEKYTVEINELRSQINQGGQIVGKSPEMRKILNLSLKIAKYDAHVLITGESGVGKTLLAKFIHSNSTRGKEAFVEINCGAIPENLIESELFGYEPGSFTGSSRQGKVGLIEIANKGTLFLDEISELPLNMQVKLLKVIQDKSFVKVGGTKEVHADFRLITASNKNMQEQINNNEFREDLFYRINVLNIDIPPLRERQEDIIELIRYKMEYFNNKYHEKKTLSPRVYDTLLSYSWPGNIRELENMIERIILTSEEKEIAEDSIRNFIQCTTVDSLKSSDGSGLNLSARMDEFEKTQIVNSFKKHKTSIGVAKDLGISQPTAYRKIKKYLPDNQIV